MLYKDVTNFRRFKNKVT